MARGSIGGLAGPAYGYLREQAPELALLQAATCLTPGEACAGPAAAAPGRRDSTVRGLPAVPAFGVFGVR
jgi:hypothetical protein